MANAAKRTFSLPASHMAYVEAKVASGDYASGSEVIRAGLRALQERDAAIDRWLLTEVAPVYDAMERAPDRAIPARDGFKAIREQILAQDEPA